MYDWANSAYVTTVIAVVFPLYYASVVSEGLPREVATSRFATATAVALGVVAVLSPVLGALSDRAGRIKQLLGIFVGLGVLSTLGLATVGRGDWAWGLVLFGLGNVGVTGSIVFSDALLRHIARDDELDRVSTAGYALGYLGGGLLLAAQLVLLLKPAAGSDWRTRRRPRAWPSSPWRCGGRASRVPLFLRIPEPKPGGQRPRPGACPCAAPSRSWRETLAGCASTGRRCCCWWRTCSTATASAPSSGCPRCTGRSWALAGGR